MYCTEKNLIQLYEDITRQAMLKVANSSTPLCDMPDIISSAYLKALKKLSRHNPRENREKLFQSICRSEIINQLAKRDSIQNLHERFDLRLDAARANDESEIADDDECTGDAISDHGAGADRIRYFDEVDDFDREPDWVYATRAEEKKHCGKPLSVIRGLKKTMNYEIVRQNVCLSRHLFGKILKKLQVRFDQCFRAYHAWLVEKSFAKI